MYEIQRLNVILRTKNKEEYDKIRDQETEYMLKHLESLENPEIIIECVFGCGRLSEINSDLCGICEAVYMEYLKKNN